MLLLIYKKLKQDFYKDPVTSDIDSIAVTFNDVNQHFRSSTFLIQKLKLLKQLKIIIFKVNLDD
jgi:hypothetical protein